MPNFSKCRVIIESVRVTTKYEFVKMSKILMLVTSHCNGLKLRTRNRIDECGK